MEDWEALGEPGKEVYYRKWQCYKMDWEDVDLDHFVVCGAPVGGPLCLVRDPSKLVALPSHSSTLPRLYIYSSAGRKLAEVDWGEYSSRRIVGIGWTPTEELVVILEDGMVIILSMLGETTSKFNLLPDAGTGFLDMAYFFSSGFVAMDGSKRLHMVADLSDPTPSTLPVGALREAEPTCIAAIEASQSASGMVEVFVASRDRAVHIVDEEKARTRDSKLDSAIVRMAVVPNGRYVACFTEGGRLHVLQSDFSSVVLSFAEQLPLTPPHQFVWCGDDAVVLSWRGEGIMMVGPRGDWVRWNYADEESLVLVHELDSVRVITDDFCEALQRVPPAAVAAQQFGSTAPVALLMDAMRSFQDGDAKADDAMRGIKQANQLEEAVSQCLDAAVAEYTVDAQARYLRAASYGKCFFDEKQALRFADRFVDAARKLRVMNALRAPEVGIPITSQQFDHVGPEGAVDRLVTRHRHFLALRICDYLRVPRERVLLHWACARVRAGVARGESDERIRDTVRAKLVGTRGVSYADVALAAGRADRPKLATMLLECEPRAADQIPLLLAMGEPKLALQKAVESGQTDLIYFALLDIRRKVLADKSDKALEQFFSIVFPFPLAVNLLIKYCRFQDRPLLRDVLFALNRAGDASKLLIKEALAAPSRGEKEEALRLAGEILKEGVARGHKDLQFHIKMVQEQAVLVNVQYTLEEATGESVFVDTAVTEMLYNCVSAGFHTKAVKLRAEFKVPDQRFWHTKVRALAESGDFAMLRKFANERKSPIGYKPFVDACLKEGNIEAALEYAERVTDPEERIAAFMEAGDLRRAAEEAIKARSEEALRDIVQAPGADEELRQFILQRMKAL